MTFRESHLLVPVLSDPSSFASRLASIDKHSAIALMGTVSKFFVTITLFSATTYSTRELLVESWVEPLGIFPASGNRTLTRGAWCHLMQPRWEFASN
jgi:hypothetical protein